MDFTVNHIGFAVSDLDRTTEFYEKFGATMLVDRARAHGHDVDHGMGLTNADVEIRHLRLGSVVLELHQFHSPQPHPFNLRNCDVGAAHIAFQVDDLKAAYDELVANGVEMVSPPNPIIEGPHAGGAWMYARDPDGIWVEFIQAGSHSPIDVVTGSSE